MRTSLAASSRSAPCRSPVTWWTTPPSRRSRPTRSNSSAESRRCALNCAMHRWSKLSTRAGRGHRRRNPSGAEVEVRVSGSRARGRPPSPRTGRPPARSRAPVCLLPGEPGRRHVHEPLERAALPAALGAPPSQPGGSRCRTGAPQPTGAAAAHQHATLGPVAGVDLVMAADVSTFASDIARSVSTPGRLAKVRAPRGGRRSSGGSVLGDRSFVRSHSLSSSRATPIEGPGRFEDHDEQ